VVFHLAALKHIPICEDFPDEAIKTNVAGTQNIIRASIHNGVRKVIDVSTDKAVDPLNVYGVTKALGEKLILYADRDHTTTRFVCVRGGNVLGSNGSVVPHFINRIKNGQSLEITSKDMTRYFLTIPEAISLLFVATESEYAGVTFVMNMPACRIIDLAEVIADVCGKPKTEIVETGIRAGEKLHEVLISRYESPKAYVYDEHYYMICNGSVDVHGFKRVSFDEYSSKQNMMTKKQIHQLLKKGGFV
jgi:FlaA1/EpsC-like NDP-sugar epimerase